MVTSSGFQPDWASAPGQTVADLLKERGIPLQDFAAMLGQSSEAVEDLIAGRVAITRDLAKCFENTLGASAEFWMRRESQYRADLSRLQRSHDREIDARWLSSMPVKDMVKLGWIPGATGPNCIAELLSFFNVPNVSAWHDKYETLLDTATFKTSPSFKTDIFATAAWLRQGEILAESVACRPWSPTRFDESLSEIRLLTRKSNPAHFVPALQEICARSGVATIILRAPTGCRASGATRFTAPDKALLLLSFRHLSDDHFWFSFFHEAGHLLLHEAKTTFIEGDSRHRSVQEDEANEFAASRLIPVEYMERMCLLGADAREIIRFAKVVGVSPGIVVGQLQHLGLLKRHQFNSLKRRFTWAD